MPSKPPVDPNAMVPTEYGPMQFHGIFGPQAQRAGQLPTPAPPNPEAMAARRQQMAQRIPMAPPLGGAPFPGGRSGLTVGMDRPMDLPEQPSMPSGFDPTAQTPFSMGYGGPRLNTEGALAGLRNGSQHPLLALIGQAHENRQADMQGGQAGQAASQQRLQSALGFVDQQLAPQRERQASIETALAQQHPAILGLEQFRAEQKALPQQYEAQGRILAEREQARGIMGGAAQNAQGRQRAAVIAGLAPLLAQLGLSQERQQQSAVDDLDEFAQPNQQAVQALQQIIAEYLQRPEFDF
jgi:hypothetical protein